MAVPTGAASERPISDPVPITGLLGGGAPAGACDNWGDACAGRVRVGVGGLRGSVRLLAQPAPRRVASRAAAGARRGIQAILAPYLATSCW